MRELIKRIGIAIVIVLTGVILSTAKTNYTLDGARILPLIGKCEVWILEEPVQPEVTYALACPKIDLIKLWPLPISYSWDESSNNQYR